MQENRSLKRTSYYASIPSFISERERHHSSFLCLITYYFSEAFKSPEPPLVLCVRWVAFVWISKQILLKNDGNKRAEETEQAISLISNTSLRTKSHSVYIFHPFLSHFRVICCMILVGSPSLLSHLIGSDVSGLTNYCLASPCLPLHQFSPMLGLRCSVIQHDTFITLVRWPCSVMKCWKCLVGQSDATL